MTKKDGVLILAVSGVLLLTSLITRAWIGRDALLVTLILAFAAVLIFIIEVYRRVESNSDKLRDTVRFNFKQTEALFSIFSSIQPRHPLPATRGWAASPDILKKLIELVMREKPQLVVEASSGVSTLIIAHCLKQLGSGKVVALEQEAKYARRTEEALALHGLTDVASVIHAPLTEFDIKGRSWLWYDNQRLTLDAKIDLLVIDGPPNRTQRLARYPALPMLYDRLRDGSIVLLDDGGRPEEQEMVALWLSELAGLSQEFLDVEKGAYLLRKQTKHYAANDPTLLPSSLC